jgi:signal transduction histidine kinase
VETQAPYRIPPDVAPSALEALAERLPIGVIVLRPPGDVLWANTRARAVFGERPHTISPHVAGAFAGHEILTKRVQVEREGRTLVIELRAAPLDGVRSGAVVVFEEVTRRARRERAEAEFVENAAHQLRSPVAAIAASVAALNAGAREERPELDRFLGHIERESRRLGDLVDGLLALAALQAGDVPPRIAVVPLAPLLRDAADAASGGPRVRIACGEDVAVVADGDLLAQALGNVIANAVEHARSEVRVDTHLHGPTVVVEVRDDGPGVAPEAGDRIFERFFRGPRASRHGSGLGLAIASAAAEAAQGTLELLPAENGSGAAFRFTIAGAKLL